MTPRRAGYVRLVAVTIAALLCWAAIAFGLATLIH